MRRVECASDHCFFFAVLLAGRVRSVVCCWYYSRSSQLALIAHEYRQIRRPHVGPHESMMFPDRGVLDVVRSCVHLNFVQHIKSYPTVIAVYTKLTCDSA